MVARTEDIGTARSALYKVLYQDDDAPDVRMVIKDMLDVAEQVAEKHPRAAAILLERSATFMQGLATTQEIEDALKSVGGVEGLKSDRIAQLWSAR